MTNNEQTTHKKKILKFGSRETSTWNMCTQTLSTDDGVLTYSFTPIYSYKLAT